MSVSIVPGIQATNGAHSMRWWSDEQQLRVALAMEMVLRAWEHDWGMEQTHPVEDAVRCCMAFEQAARAGSATPANWKPVSLNSASEPACEFWWDSSPLSRPGAASVKSAAVTRKVVETELVSVLIGALFGSQSEPSVTGEAAGIAEVAAEVAKSAWADLWRRIGAALQITVATDTPSTHPDYLSTLLPAPQCFQPWSGAVLVSLHWCGQELRILLGGSEMEVFLRHQKAMPAHLAAEKGPLAPLWEAVSPLACAVRAELEPVELTLGAVKALRIGDVIELPHRLDNPLLAKTATGELLCEAFLGKAGTYRAIELLRSPPKAL